MVKITLLGVPVPKGRPRFSVRGGFARAYTPAKTRNYEEALAIEGKLAMKGSKPLEGALDVELVAYLPIPKSATKKDREKINNLEIMHTKKPDLDNLGKCDKLHISKQNCVYKICEKNIKAVGLNNKQNF